MAAIPSIHQWRSALAIVAHPDDETIWSGGLLLQTSNWDWTVLSLCRANDPDRHRKFVRVCHHFGAVALMSDLDDSCPLQAINPRREVSHRIRPHVLEREWDVCVTHGPNGEYGHQRHREIHGAVRQLLDEGILPCRELLTFACDCDPQTGNCKARSDAHYLLHLTDDQLAEKRRIVHEMYGYGRDSFEVRACASPEGFNLSRPAEEGETP